MSGSSRPLHSSSGPSIDRSVDVASVSPPGPQIDLMLFSYAGQGRGVSAAVISSAGVLLTAGTSLRRQARERSQEVSGNIPNCETGALGGILQLQRVLVSHFHSRR